MAFLLPVPPDRRLRRLGQLYPGLAIYGFSTALLVRANLGLNPWDVFHQGVALRSGFSLGMVTIATSAVVLLLWIPIRQRLGVGTISNGILIGVFVDLSLHFLPTPTDVALRVGFLIAGILLNGFATGLYIGAGLGPGPRDGLMTGLARDGRSIRVVRTSIEVTVLVFGWLLGGSVGVGTVAYALAIGPLAHVLIPALTVGTPAVSGRPEDHAAT